MAVEGVDMAEVLLVGRRGPGVEPLLRSLAERDRDGRRYIASAARLQTIRASGCAATQGARPRGAVVVAQGSRRVQPCRLLGLPVVKGAGCC